MKGFVQLAQQQPFQEGKDSGSKWLTCLFLTAEAQTFLGDGTEISHYDNVVLGAKMFSLAWLPASSQPNWYEL